MVKDGDHNKLPVEFIDSPNEGVRYLRAQDLREGEILADAPIFVKREYFESLPRSHIKPGYFLFSIMASIGNIAVVPEGFPDCTANRAVGILILKDIERLDAKYLLALFGSNFGINLLEKLTRGGIQKRTNLGDIENLRIPLPPLEIQQSLVAEIEAARQNRKQKLAQADELFTSTDTYFLKQLGIKLSIKPGFVNAQCFGVKRRNVGIRLDPFYSLPEHQVLETALSDCPSKVLAIGDESVVREIVEGRITPKPEFYSEDPKDPIFLRAQNIEKGYLNFSDAKRLKRDALEDEPKAILLDGDIVLTIDGALLGIAAVHRSGDEDCCISNHMVRMQHGVETDPEYLAWFLNSSAGQRQIKRGTTGSAIPGIRTDAIARILVPIPPLEVQRSLVIEIEKRRADAQRLRQEAETEWEAAKTRFEQKLLGEES